MKFKKLIFSLYLLCLILCSIVTLGACNKTETYTDCSCVKIYSNDGELIETIMEEEMTVTIDSNKVITVSYITYTDWVGSRDKITKRYLNAVCEIYDTYRPPKPVN